jgi:hypothetical protein
MMKMRAHAADPGWVSWFGVGLFVAVASAGYFYNLTFVQLGLVDLGSRVLELPAENIARAMALLAGVTLLVALGTGLVMHHRRWSERFDIKLRLLAVVVVLQTALTVVAPQLRSEAELVVWIVMASIGLGLGVPSLFGLTCDLVPTRHRGMVAAVVTSAAFLPAAVFSSDWRIDQFAAQMLWLMVPSAVVLVVLAFVPWPVTASLARQHRLSDYGPGRFVHQGPRGWPRTAFTLTLALMFGVYFVDSLGFIRIVDTPVYLRSSWGSTDSGTLWAIGIVHAVAAVCAGILYRVLSLIVLLAWVFGLFAVVHLSYVFHALTTPELPPALGMPLLYAVTVSIYTVLNFSIWADFSTPATIARNTALGVGVAGWLATFLSTSLSIWWAATELPFAEHLRAVAAISLSLFSLCVVLFLFRKRKRFHQEEA